jgi:type III restriction enzyme
MKQVVIENPVINSPFREPNRHFRFTDEGITNDVIDGRRSRSYFVPIARPCKKGQKQLVFDTEWTRDRIEENELVNQIRARVKLWREGGYVGVTPTTSRLLAYWTDPDREKRLFFCQIEAPETAILFTKVITYTSNGYGPDDVPNLLIKVTREQKWDKVATAGTLWGRAVNNHGGFGRWHFIEIADPWDAKGLIRSVVEAYNE